MFKSIDKNIPVPLYYQISQQIRQQIESGELEPGDHLPTESELQERFGVSRATIRQAISGLAYEGLLERKRSKGTVVSRAKLQETLYGMGSFTRQMMKQNRTIRSKILGFQLIPCPDNVTDHLQLGQGEQVVALERLRIVDDEPVAVENWYAPLRLLPGIDASFFGEKDEEQSTYYMLQERYGIHLFKAVDSMSAVVLQPREARLLRMEPYTPALLRTRVTYAGDEIPVIYASGMYIMTLNIVLEAAKG